MEPLRREGCRSWDRVADPFLARYPEAASTYVVAFEECASRVASGVGCSFDDAVDLMLDRASIIGCSLGDLAAGMLEGRVQFDG